NVAVGAAVTTTCLLDDPQGCVNKAQSFSRRLAADPINTSVGTVVGGPGDCVGGLIGTVVASGCGWTESSYSQASDPGIFNPWNEHDRVWFGGVSEFIGVAWSEYSVTEGWGYWWQDPFDPGNRYRRH
ncbi:MAG: hypothetical protein RL518_2623, partial [Pseudomonadota bacterium]